ncbi:MAG: hypothetical protein K9I71_12235 [Ignavibacteriales bacterium]|nr:hypothetical protein [Ignavibacteriales bacterium]MCF8316890.1 hypothetical protein [Ignavibacteriales bacterium]MCF8438451.1 hypothetical protein [Ignavibacteriales bacterium]
MLKNEHSTNELRELLRFIIYVISVVTAAILFYGAIDKRVTILETEYAYKIDRKELYESLEKMKNEINLKIEKEFEKHFKGNY